MNTLFAYTKSMLTLALLSGWGFANPSTQAAEIRASLSSHEAYLGSSITLSLEIVNADTSVVPTIPQIDGLDIQSLGSPSRSSQTTIINGRRSHRVSETHAWQIVPRREGAFVIPSLGMDLGGKTVSTRPLRFVVTHSETGDLLFAEIVGHDEKIFVGQPMNLRLKIWVKPYQDRALGIKLGEADMWQMISHDRSNWGIFDEHLQKMAANRQRPPGREVLREDEGGNSHSYYLYETSATIYPKRSGEVDGNGVQVVVDYPTRLGKSRDPFDSFFGGGRSSFFGGRMPSMFGQELVVSDARPIVATASVNATQVTDIPTENRPEDYRGAVGRYAIATQATPTEVQAGDPITLHMGIHGNGPMDLVQAPALNRLFADFRVSDDPLAGIVQDDTKLFTVTIRPRREGITELPAIPLTYFDPQLEEFVTVYSQPITLHVTAGNNLAASAIVGRHVAASDAATVAEEKKPRTNYNNYTDDSILQASHAKSDFPWVLAYGLPPLFFLVLVVGRKRSHWSSWLSLLPGAATRNVNGMLELAQTPGEIVEAIRIFLASFIGPRSRATAPREMLAELRLQGFVGLDECESLLQHCEQSSYAAANEVNVVGLIGKAKACLAAISTQRQ